ncbi:hypothetical protein [Amycolatopsis jiangsuensis]|uniref:DUF5709 domain-containing protein n=1 Tax=Amycolatopsis jiangsuensis TaxID=1181879 RepID=A0A840IS26_9PSEU|nr:hypothetical protein [Amycolatopsis jiangsuensis]MBB4684022.1 hypothetical protein [Amycolatopsis jiangsuensis]
MTDREPSEPETLTPMESLDEDDLRVDPLETGVEPPEHWSPAARSGTTPAEVREGEPLGRRLAEEEPDVQPGAVPERPIAATPAAELDDSVDAAPADGGELVPDDVPAHHSDPDPVEQADEAGGSVADSLRTE